MTKEEYDKKFFEEITIKKNTTKELEKKYKVLLKDFAIQYVALWNACQSLGLNDRQTKGLIEFILNRESCDDIK